jgi:hypothetical protein
MALPDTLRRRLRADGARALAVLVVVTLAIAVSVCVDPYHVPLAALLVPLMAASLLLGPRPLSWFVVYLVMLLTVGVYFEPLPLSPVGNGAVATDYVLALIVLVVSFRRSRLGVSGMRGEEMFIDLRDRILDQADLPPLPEEWFVETAIRSAGGTLFSGDFVLATRTGRDRFEVALVDVSGKGQQAGTRALQLSGAFGGLLGSVPAADFLTAANGYLLRQDWAEGFATAVHLAIDLVTGDFELRTAGHPPALARCGLADAWQRVDSGGPFLGLVEDPEFVPACGRLAAGDAIVLYTDGMVEEPRRDIEIGIDRLAEEAAAQVATSLTGSARRLVDRLGSKGDDRCLVVVSRRAGWGA